MSVKSEHRIVILRKLLGAGLDLLDDRYEISVGGLDSSRDVRLDLVGGASAIVADPSVPVDDELLDRAGSALMIVANFAVGHDNVDLEACAARGVTVTNTPDVLTDATAELAVALTLAAARDIPAAERSLRTGGWSGWDPADYRGFELSGSTVGVVGMGRIGRRYAEMMSGFGVGFLYTSREAKPAVEASLGARRVGLERLLAESDAVSLHLPASDETHHTINDETVRLMKPDAVLVNTGRGALVDSLAVAAALDEGRLGAAGLDVFEGEPDVPAELLKAPRTALTPHIGSATYRARDRMAELVARNVIAVLEGDPPLTPVGSAPSRPD